MKIQDLTNEERQFLNNLLLERRQDASKYDTESLVLDGLLLSFVFVSTEVGPRENGFLQFLMQEQSEIWGRLSSTANEKQPVVLGSFVPQKTRQLIKAISDKLGAHIEVDVLTPSLPISPRAEGSQSIMTDPTLNK